MNRHLRILLKTLYGHPLHNHSTTDGSEWAQRGTRVWSKGPSNRTTNELNAIFPLFIIPAEEYVICTLSSPTPPPPRPALNSSPKIDYHRASSLPPTLNNSTMTTEFSVAIHGTTIKWLNTPVGRHRGSRHSLELLLRQTHNTSTRNIR